MNLQNLLESKVTDFVLASINRVSVTGDLCHRYRITVQEIKDATGLQRLHEGSVVSYLSANFNIDATLDKAAGVFQVELDLTKCVLDARQSSSLSTAMEMFRAEKM